MSVHERDVVAAFRNAACGELEAAVMKIRHCLAQLDDAQLWWQPAEDMNAIGNLLLHLCGNVRQWIVAGVGGAPDTRRRWEEFEQREPIAKAELTDRLNSTVADAVKVLQSLSADGLCGRHRIQGFDVTGAEAIFDSIAHFRGHTQEIVHITRQQLGNAYRFDFVPQTPEQGRP